MFGFTTVTSSGVIIFDRVIEFKRLQAVLGCLTIRDFMLRFFRFFTIFHVF